MRNPILKIFDKEFVAKLFKKRVMPKYPDFTKIKKIIIIPHKRLIWEHTYHVVIEYKTTFITRDNKMRELPIYCAAHSNEPRKNVYNSLKFLWENSFSRGYLTIPHPLFYSEKLRGTFYRGVYGHHLYYYIRKKDYKTIESVIPKTAAWFAKLHDIPVRKAKNFNKKNSRIKTVFPGVKHILRKINEKYPQYYKLCKNIYNQVIKKEENFLTSTNKRWLVHGDAHPENVIKMGEKKIAVIDFTDLCLSDFARDIGSFMQQLEYMSFRKIGDFEYSEKLKKMFLEYYLLNAKIKLDEFLNERIKNYYNWTALRTATFFLIKEKEESERAEPLLSQLSKSIEK